MPFSERFMKIKLHHIFFLTILATFAVAGNVWAQDAGMSDVEILDERDRIDSEKMLYSPGEAEVRYIPKATTASVSKDSAAAVLVVVSPSVRETRTESPPAKGNEKQPAKPKDDSILTFNFLYYIIQKYKLQDIID